MTEEAEPDAERAPLSVLHVSQATRFGVGQYLDSLVTDQVRRGWDVALACPPNEQLESTCRREGVAHHRWDARRSPGWSVRSEMRTLRSIIDQIAPDVIHLHSSKAGLVGRLSVRAARPTIFTPHAWSFLHGSPMTRRAALAWERRGARWADLILCGSTAERERGEGVGIRARFGVVRNAVNLDRFPAATSADREQARRDLGLGGDPLAVCVGRLVRQKGQDVLIDAWPAVRRHVPDATLALVGEGDLHDRLARRVTSGVALVGAPGDIRPWLAAADLVVQPSRWETLSASVLEALASGRSVVATDVEGMREAIGDDSDTPAGVVVPLDDSDALATAIARRLGDPVLVEAEERHARERIAAFGLGPWGDAYAAATREVVAARRGPPR